MVEKKNNPPDHPHPQDLAPQVRELLNDSDLMRAYWEQGHGHLWALTWQKITSAVGRWLIAAIASGLGAALIVYGVQHGWWK